MPRTQERRFGRVVEQLAKAHQHVGRAERTLRQHVVERDELVKRLPESSGVESWAEANFLANLFQRRNSFPRASSSRSGDPVTQAPTFGQVSAKLLDGRALAAELRAELGARVAALSDRGVIPRLVVALAGEDPSSLAYVRGLEKLGAQLGVEVAIDRLPVAIGESAFRSALDGYGRDAAIHGVLVQQPLPAPLSMRALADAVPNEKDVDCAHPLNQARLAFGTSPLFIPATPRAVMLLLERSEKWPLRGCEATVIGRSSVVGLPVAMLLLARDATVTIAHSKTADLRAQAQRAEILVVAAGVPHLVDASYVGPGATVIDVGTTVVDGKLRGDVDFESVSAVAAELTTVPGGVGPVTNVALMGNVVTAAENLS